jgi:hypothetical protein
MATATMRYVRIIFFVFKYFSFSPSGFHSQQSLRDILFQGREIPPLTRLNFQPAITHQGHILLAAFMDHLERSMPDGSATASTRDIAILMLLFFFQLSFLF